MCLYININISIYLDRWIDRWIIRMDIDIQYICVWILPYVNITIKVSRQILLEEQNEPSRNTIVVAFKNIITLKLHSECCFLK